MLDRSIKMSISEKITLESSNGEAFEVAEAVALESQTIKHMTEDDCADNGIPFAQRPTSLVSCSLRSSSAVRSTLRHLSPTTVPLLASMMILRLGRPLSLISFLMQTIRTSKFKSLLDLTLPDCCRHRGDLQDI